MADLLPHGVFALALAFASGGCGSVETRSADRFAGSGELIAMSGGNAGASNACFTCHGLDGGGNGAGAPRLAGLDAGYLDRQLIAFADGRRRHPEMQWIAERMSARDRQAVSSYYAAMPNVSRSAGPTDGAGMLLYLRGKPSRGMPACAECHGHRGEGSGPGNPPLAGQPAAYLADQLYKWRRSERRNDPGGVMLTISQRLTPREVEEVSAYASALPGDLRRQAPQAAFPAARHAGPRSGALAPPPHARE